jgi:hypothetical protein
MPNQFFTRKMIRKEYNYNTYLQKYILAAKNVIDRLQAMGYKIKNNNKQIEKIVYNLQTINITKIPDYIKNLYENDLLRLTL